MLWLSKHWIRSFGSYFKGLAAGVRDGTNNLHVAGEADGESDEVEDGSVSTVCD